MLIEITGMVACYPNYSCFTRNIEHFLLKNYNLMFLICIKHKNMCKVLDKSSTLYCITYQLHVL